MNILKPFIFICVFLIFGASYAQPQTSKKIRIEIAGFATPDTLRGEGVTVFTRDNSQQVHFTHDGVSMWCDQAVYYEKEDFIEAYSNVIMNQGDTINMTAKYAEYSGKTKLAFSSGDVVLTEPKSILTTDTLYFDRIRQQAFYKSKGKIVRDSSGTITSQIGRYYMEQKKYQFVQDVVLVNPEYTLNTEHLDFYTETGHAYMYGPSTIVGETSIIYTERGFYDTNNDTGYFVRNSKINYENREVVGDSMYFDRKISFASATNNIMVTDTLNNSVARGHYAEVWRAKDSVFITKRALAITVQEKDSIYMHSDTLMVTGKPEHRITRAYYNAKIYKSDLSGKADSIHADHKTGLTQLINLDRFSSTDAFVIKRKPILWNLGNQMTGDTIHLISNPETEQLDSLIVFDNAFVLSRDTIGESQGFNQIKGLKLIGLFKDNELYNIDIIKNAEVIYYTRDGNNELVGINKSRSGSINIKISNNEIDEIRMLQDVSGDLYPESMFPENAQKFRGFDWREEERPLSVEDLFKDDSPLELPVIKGLEDSVPQEEFFDEELLNRIKLAGKHRYIMQDKNDYDVSVSNDNILNSNYDFNSDKWFKKNVTVSNNSLLSPLKDFTASNIVCLNEKSGYLYYSSSKTTGKFKFSIWLKGRGEIKLILQEDGGNNTDYNSLNVSLTQDWKQYTFTCNKENDGNKLRIVINNITKKNNVYLWGAELLEVN